MQTKTTHTKQTPHHHCQSKELPYCLYFPVSPLATFSVHKYHLQNWCPISLTLFTVSKLKHLWCLMEMFWLGTHSSHWFHECTIFSHNMKQNTGAIGSWQNKCDFIFSVIYFLNSVDTSKLLPFSICSLILGACCKWGLQKNWVNKHAQLCCDCTNWL